MTSEVRGDGELVVVASDGSSPDRLGADLVPALAGRFRVATSPPDAETGELVRFVSRLAPERWAGIGVGRGGGALLEAAMHPPGAEVLVLIGPRGLDAVLDRGVDLASWEAPVLILGGEDDPSAPVASLERLHELMPSSSLGLVPGCGDPLTDAWDTIGPMVLEYLRARYLRLPHGHGDTSGVVALQLERRPPWVDLAEYEQEDPEPTRPDPAGQEVGPGA